MLLLLFSALEGMTSDALTALTVEDVAAEEGEDKVEGDERTDEVRFSPLKSSSTSPLPEGGMNERIPRAAVQRGVRRESDRGEKGRSLLGEDASLNRDS